MAVSLLPPEKAAAISCLYSLLVGLFYYRGLNRQSLRKILSNTVNTTSMIYLLVGTAVLMNVFFTYTKIPPGDHDLCGCTTLSSTGFLNTSSFSLLMFGFFLDALPIIYICAPLLFPAAVKLGISPMVFSVLFCLALMIGRSLRRLVLPLCDEQFLRIPADRVIRGSVPFLFAMVAGMLILILWPDLSQTCRASCVKGSKNMKRRKLYPSGKPSLWT